MKKILQKYLDLLDEYVMACVQFIMPEGGDPPPPHPYIKISKSLLDDEEFILESMIVDNGECFKYISKRLKNKKEFVLEALDYYNTSYKDISLKLQKDIDIIKAAKANNFKDFGKDIIINKDKIYEIYEDSKNKDFKSY